jgi:hypothetical protein
MSSVKRFGAGSIGSWPACRRRKLSVDRSPDFFRLTDFPPRHGAGSADPFADGLPGPRLFTRRIRQRRSGVQFNRTASPESFAASMLFLKWMI